MSLEKGFSEHVLPVLSKMKAFVPMATIFLYKYNSIIGLSVLFDSHPDVVEANLDLIDDRIACIT